MKKLIIASTAILMGMTATAMASGLEGSVGPSISINNAKIGNTRATIKIHSTPADSDMLPNAGEFYGAISVGPAIQQSAYRISINNFDLSLGLDPEPLGESNLKEVVFYNVNTQYTPTFEYPAAVENITTNTSSLTVDVNWNTDEEHDVELDWPF